MNLTRIMALVNKDIKKTVREPAALFLTLLFPVMLMLFFGLAFGRAGGESTYRVGVVNLDAGGPQSRWSGYFLGNLTSVGVIKTVEYAANETAQADLSQGSVQAVLIIPSGFGQSCSSFWTAADPSLWVRASVQLYLDSGSMFATQAIPPIVQQALEATIRGPQRTTAQLPVELASPSLVASAKLTAFDYMAPGVFAFATIFLVLIVSSSFTVERRRSVEEDKHDTGDSIGIHDGCIYCQHDISSSTRAAALCDVSGRGISLIGRTDGHSHGFRYSHGLLAVQCRIWVDHGNAIEIFWCGERNILHIRDTSDVLRDIRRSRPAP